MMYGTMCFSQIYTCHRKNELNGAFNCCLTCDFSKFYLVLDWLLYAYKNMYLNKDKSDMGLS